MIRRAPKAGDCNGNCYVRQRDEMTIMMENCRFSGNGGDRISIGRTGGHVMANCASCGHIETFDDVTCISRNLI